MKAFSLRNCVTKKISVLSLLYKKEDVNLLKIIDLVKLISLTNVDYRI